MQSDNVSIKKCSLININPQEPWSKLHKLKSEIKEPDQTDYIKYGFTCNKNKNSFVE